MPFPVQLQKNPFGLCRESFGKGWNDDAIKHLGLKSITRELKADYGSLPDFSQSIHINNKYLTYIYLC
jgi:hypothetical protein